MKLDNLRYEKFCKNIVDGMSIRAAYMKAYDVDDEMWALASGNRLLTVKPEIKARIKELREKKIHLKKI